MSPEAPDVAHVQAELRKAAEKAVRKSERVTNSKFPAQTREHLVLVSMEMIRKNWVADAKLTLQALQARPTDVEAEAVLSDCYDELYGSGEWDKLPGKAVICLLWAFERLVGDLQGTSGIPSIRRDGGDWTEDATLENGNYANLCSECGFTFTGHKRRVVCKRCAK